MEIYDVLKDMADIRNRSAIRTLEHRGFVFGVHFGTENAYDRLQAMDQAVKDRRLYEHLRIDLGIITAL